VKRYLLLFVAFLIGAVAGRFLWPDEESRPSLTGEIERAFAAAKAYYVNENSADCRRARLELAPLEDLFGDGVAFHLDMALIDLQEINYRVQDQDRLLPEPDYERLLRSALAHLERARAIDPASEAVAYNLARTYLKLAPHADDRDKLLAAAEELLRPLVGQDPPDPSALLLFGNLRWDRGDVEGAHAAYDRIVELGKDYVPRTLFFVGLSKAAATLRRPPLLRPDEAEELEALRERLYPEAPKVTDAKLERGRYTRFLEMREAPKTLPDPRDMNWVLVTGRSGVPKCGTPPFFIAPDLDGDCARDLVVNAEAGLRVLRNRRNASFEDMTAAAGLPTDLVLAGAAAGDMDGDGRCDLVLGSAKGLRLYLNKTDEEEPNRWRFVLYDRLPDGSAAFGGRGDEPVDCVALWDLDHDGDLDVFAGGARNRLYRTAIEQPIEGGKYFRFVEMAGELGLAEPPATDALILDVEDDQDVDLLVAGPRGNAWFENLRELRFERRDLPAGAGLDAADVDNDLQEEVRVGRAVHKWRDGTWTKLFDRPVLLDLDSDGVIDDEPFAGFEIRGNVVRALGVDLNRDDAGGGGRDLLLLTDAGLDVYLSLVESPRGWIDLRPRGLKTNELGIGTRLRLYADDLRIGATCRDGLVHFGLGRRPLADAVLLRWTNGVEQGVVAPPLTTCFDIEEREGEVGSCPFLYAFDGRRWHFVADCQSGTPLGLPVADGVYLEARTDETILVPGDRLRPVQGTLRLDLAEEFRELLYLDRVVLRAIDHPEDVRPVLNEGFRVRSYPEFGVYGLRDLRPPRAARDHRGNDVTKEVRARDGRHARVFEKIGGRFPGLAREWAIELEFGDLPESDRVLLVMDGWVEFPTASASIAASQTKTVKFMPPVLEARQSDGSWKVVDPDPGFPAGKGKAVLVDLTGEVGREDVTLRLRSTQRLHWDAFGIATAPDGPLRLHEIPLTVAEHRFRGVGERIEDPLGEAPWTYSHDDLVRFVPYDQQPAGMLTRYGDVSSLLAEIDDRYPVLAAGDVVELSFDASALPPLPEGWVRDYCFTTEGWVKDADMNQAVRETVTPLPFHAMSKYPYDETKESHPHPDFVERWFTRPARKLVDPEALFAPR